MNTLSSPRMTLAPNEKFDMRWGPSGSERFSDLVDLGVSLCERPVAMLARMWETAPGIPQHYNIFCLTVKHQNPDFYKLDQKRSDQQSFGILRKMLKL